MVSMLLTVAVYAVLLAAVIAPAAGAFVYNTTPKNGCGVYLADGYDYRPTRVLIAETEIWDSNLLIIRC